MKPEYYITLSASKDLSSLHWKLLSDQIETGNNFSPTVADAVVNQLILNSKIVPVQVAISAISLSDRAPIATRLGQFITRWNELGVTGISGEKEDYVKEFRDLICDINTGQKERREEVFDRTINSLNEILKTLIDKAL